jgi:hypothetical protein
MKVADIVQGMATDIVDLYWEKRRQGIPHNEAWQKASASLMKALNDIDMLVQMEAAHKLVETIDLRTGEKK